MKDLDRAEHNKMMIVENLVWEIAKTLSPNSYIDPKKVEKIKSNLIKRLSE